MPAVLDKAAASKQEEFVEKQIAQARSRIRTLDYFTAGLTLLIGTFAFALAVLLVDRYVETPAGSGWAVIGLYILGAAGYLYWAILRPSRRHINPYYAACKVEQTIPDAKNSVINYVDLKDDERVPGSVKTAIGVKAARDLKHVDLARAIQRKQILWLAAVAGVFCVAALVAAFLPPTRTSMALLAPKGGNITIDQGKDLTIEVELRGFVPEKGQPDAPRVRLWYNPEDPGTYEERALEPIEGQRHGYALTIPAKQIRNGFFYRVMVAKIQTDDFQVKVRIIPQFMSWEVQYKFPDYVGHEPQKTGDANLVGYYDTEATITAYTNRPVQAGHIEIDGQIEHIPGQLVDGTPEAIRFQMPMKRNGSYRVRFVTTDNEQNPDPQRFRISLMDPTPAFLRYDVTYDYPKYLRYDPPTAKVTVKEPHLEAMRGTKVTLRGYANRKIESATVQFPGHDQPITGVVSEDQSTQAEFKLPPMMQDGALRVVFTPKTGEKESEPRTFSVRVLTDGKPVVEIIKPNQEEIELPANGTLGVEGIAKDDIGIAKMNLRMEVVSPGRPVPLAPKAYRDGKSFERESDHSFPTTIDYKDFVDLAKVRPVGEGGAGFKLQEGMVVEYWLEAIDNCDVPPGPNSGMSRKQRVKILRPETAEDKKKKQEQARQELEKEKREHDQKQDQQNANEKRDRQKPQPKNGEQPQQDPGGGEPGSEKPEGKDGKSGKAGGMPPMGMQDDPQLKKDDADAEQALNRVDPMKDKEPKSPPKGGKPKTGEPKSGEPMGDSDADPKQLPNPEDFKKLADKLDSDDPKERQEAQEQLKKMMEQNKKDPARPAENQKKLEDQLKNLDQEQKQDLQKAMDRLQQEMQKQNREDKVEKAAEKAMSDDPQKRAEGQKELEDLMKNPKTRDDVERQLQHLAGGQTQGERKRRLDDVMDLSRKDQPKKQPGKDDLPPPPPKKEEVDQLAKKIKDGDKKEKQEAQDKLEEMMKKDKGTREQVKKQLDDFRNKLPEEKKQEFDRAMKDLDERMAKQNGDNTPKTTPEDVKKLAQQLTSEDEKERKEAKQQLQQALEQADKDPRAREQAQQQLKEMRDSIKDDKKKQEFDQAVKQVGDAVKQHREEQAAARQKELENIAKDLNSKDPDKKQAAQDRLEKAMKDGKDRQAVKEQLDKIKQDTKDETAKQNIDEAIQKAEDKLAKREPGTGSGPKKEELEKLAKDLNGDNAEARKAAQKKLEELMQDPKNRDAVREQMEKVKQETGDGAAKKTIDEAMRRAEESNAKKDADAARKEELDKLAKDLNSKDTTKRQAAQEKLDEMMRDPKERDAIKKEMDKIKQGLGDDAAKKNLDDAMKKSEETAKKGDTESKVKPEDVAKLADKLQNGTPDEKAQAQKDLEKMLQDPKTRAQAEKELNDIKKGLAGEQAKKDLENAINKAKDSVAKSESPPKDEPPSVTKEDIDKIVKGLNGKDPKDAERAKKDLEDILKDPKKRADYDKQVAEMMKDPKRRQELRDAFKQLSKSELAKITEQLKSQKPEEREKAKEKLEQLAKEGLNRDLLKDELEESTKEIEDKQTREDFEKEWKDVMDKLAKRDAQAKKDIDLKKHDGKKTGNNTDVAEKEGPLAELRNKVKAGELQLERFKRNVTNEQLKKELGWTDKQMAEYLAKKAKQIAELKNQLEMAVKGELPMPRVGASPLDGPEKITLEAKDGSNPLQGGKYIAPPGFGDPYRRFTEEASGVAKPAAPPPNK
jgi:hypothetical protein